MGKFEEQLKHGYAERILDENIYAKEANKDLYDIEETGFQYDFEQVMDHLSNRMDDKSGFVNRTNRYFRDRHYATNKFHRYHRMDNNGTLAGDAEFKVEEYSEAYSYHSAFKRKGYSVDAKDAFMSMKDAMFEVIGEDNVNTSFLDKYKNRENVMKYRIEGMTAAAKVKSRSSMHEDYLISKAKLSCYLLLKEQLKELIDDATTEEDSKSVRKLSDKLVSLNKKIEKATSTLKKNTPKREEIWREQSDLADKSFIRGKKAEYSALTGKFSTEDTELLANLQLYTQEAEKEEWPMRTVLHDKNGKILNKGELDDKNWNEAHRNVEDNEELQNELEMDGIRRFIKMNPGPAEEVKNAAKYVKNNLRNYYELTKRALPYYKSKIGTDTFVGRYISEHKDFFNKIMLIDAIDKYVDFKLRSENCINFEDGQFIPEQDDEYTYKKDARGKLRRTRFGQGRENEEYDNLSAFYKVYNTNIRRKIGVKFSEDLRYQKRDVIHSAKRSSDGSRYFYIDANGNAKFVGNEEKTDNKNVELDEDSENDIAAYLYDEKDISEEEISINDNSLEEEKSENAEKIVDGMKALLKKEEEKVVNEDGKDYSFTESEYKEYAVLKVKQPKLTAKAYSVVLSKKKAEGDDKDPVNAETLNILMERVRRGFNYDKVNSLYQKAINKGSEDNGLEQYAEELMNGNMTIYFKSVNAINKIEKGMKEKPFISNTVRESPDFMRLLLTAQMFKKFFSNYVAVKYHINVDREAKKAVYEDNSEDNRIIAEKKKFLDKISG